MINDGYELVNIELIRPHPSNPRQGDVAGIVESIDGKQHPTERRHAAAVLSHPDRREEIAAVPGAGIPPFTPSSMGSREPAAAPAVTDYHRSSLVSVGQTTGGEQHTGIIRSVAFDARRNPALRRR